MTDTIHRPPPPFFKTGPAPTVRLVVFSAFAFLLLALDVRFHYLDLVREALGTVMLSIQRAASYSTSWVDAIEEEIADRARLNTEIEKLREAQYKNKTIYTQIDYLTDENNKLRALLALQNRMSGLVVAAEVIFESKDPFRRKVALDKGSRQGVVVGQAVVSADGLFGQVIRTYPMMSEVVLVSDQDSATPVQLLRNGLRAIAYGSADGEKIELRYLETNTDVQVDDRVVTSGLDGVYLPGIPVGTVTSVDRGPVSAFAAISCKPTSKLREQKHVLVITNAQRSLENPFLPSTTASPDPLPSIEYGALPILPPAAGTTFAITSSAEGSPGRR